jgi:N-acetylgalactosamine-6-sulfatase
MALSIQGATGTAASQDSKPNIIIIYADDLGWGDLSAHGHPRILTPRLDQLSAEGMDFHQFVVANPVCSPSRVALITGQFPSRLGVHEHFDSPENNTKRGMPDWLDPLAVTLPDILKKAGYATAHYGKWHLSLAGAGHGAPEPPDYGYDDAAVYAWAGPNTRNVFTGTSVERHRGVAEDPDAASYLTIAAVENTVDFIKAHKNEPFFINLWIHEPHTRITARPEDRTPYLDVPEPEQTYYAAVTRADTQIGKVLDCLDELGLSDNTIVVFSSDNGPEQPSDDPQAMTHYSRGTAGGMKGHKRSLYHGGVCVPFLVRWPGHVPAGKVDKTTLLSAVDMLPTLAAAAGVPLPADYHGDGENMLPALLGTPTNRSKPLFWKWTGDHTALNWPAYSMSDGEWTLLASEDRSRIELYNTAADRNQMQDVSAEHPERVSQMERKIGEWVASLPQTIPARLTADGKERSAVFPKPHTPSPRLSLFRLIDGRGNSDGKMTFDEFLPNSGADNDNPDAARVRFERFDANDDGILTEREFVFPAGT